LRALILDICIRWQRVPSRAPMRRSKRSIAGFLVDATIRLSVGTP